MSKFSEEIGAVLKAEGGSKYTNHPADKGGPTKYGITLRTLKGWRGKSVTASDVKNLKLSEAKAIYKSKYWDINRTTDIKSQIVAKILFDQSVNRGYKTAAKALQESCNLFPGKKLKVDGKIGSMTILRVNVINDIELANKQIQTAQDSYASIVAKKKSQAVFIRGWINRTHHLMDAFTGAKTTYPDIDISKKPPLPKEEVKENKLFERIVKHNPKINKSGLARALTFITHPKVTDKKYITFVDFDIRSSKPRMWVINTKTGKPVFHLKVAHGRHSDPNNDGYADKYSNKPGSGMSSLGAMVVDKPYGKKDGGWSKFGTATTIHGLEKGLNDNVRKRAVVFHESKYVNQVSDKISGRSLGCFAIDISLASKVQKYIHGGTLLYAWDKDFIGRA